MNKIRQEFLESAKEGLRVFLMSAIPLVIVELEQGGHFEWRAIFLAGFIALLRFVDKLLHRTKIAERGLTRF